MTPHANRLSHQSRRLLLALTEGPVSREDADRIAPAAELSIPEALAALRHHVPYPGEHAPWWVPLAYPADIAKLRSVTLRPLPGGGYDLAPAERSLLRVAMGSAAYLALYGLLPYPLRFRDRESIRLAKGEPAAVERMGRAMPRESWAPFCVLIFERIAWHGCGFLRRESLRTMVEWTEREAPGELLHEAGDRRALAAINVAAGIEGGDTEGAAGDHRQGGRHVTDRDPIQHFETTAPLSLRLLAAVGDPSGNGDTLRHAWAFMPAGAKTLDVVRAYQGDRASASRVAREMDGHTREEFAAWLYDHYTRHRCHVPRSVLAETLRAMQEPERQRLATRLGGADALADALALAAVENTEGAA